MKKVDYYFLLDTLKVNDGCLQNKIQHSERLHRTFIRNQWPLSRLYIDNLNSLELQLIELFQKNQIQNQALVRLKIDPQNESILSWEIRPYEKIDPLFFKFEKVSDRDTHFSNSFSKTWDRSYWNNLTAGLSAHEDVLIQSKEGHLIEFSRFNLFVLDKEQNRFLTPPLSSGCLDGVFRYQSLANGILFDPAMPAYPVIEENIIWSDKFKNKIYAGNSARGLIQALVK